MGFVWMIVDGSQAENVNGRPTKSPKPHYSNLHAIFSGASREGLEVRMFPVHSRREGQ